MRFHRDPCDNEHRLSINLWGTNLGASVCLDCRTEDPPHPYGAVVYLNDDDQEWCYWQQWLWNYGLTKEDVKTQNATYRMVMEGAS